MQFGFRLRKINYLPISALSQLRDGERVDLQTKRKEARKISGRQTETKFMGFRSRVSCAVSAWRITPEGDGIVPDNVTQMIYYHNEFTGTIAQADLRSIISLFNLRHENTSTHCITKLLISNL